MVKTKQTDHRNIYTIEDIFYFTGSILFIAWSLLLFLSAAKPGWMNVLKLPPCPFHLLTGYYCPGCGGTRAVAALMDGQLLRSFCYHPVVLYGLAVYSCFMVTQTIERISRRTFLVGMRYHNAYVWTAAAIVVINCLIKNILHYFSGFSL